MVKKVVLDTLEIEDADLLHKAETLPVTSEQTAPLKKAVSKKAWISLLAASIFLSIALVSYRLLTVRKPEPLAEKKIARGGSLLSTAGQPPINAAGFLVPLQDAQGKGRVLACDLAFELYVGQAARFRQNIVAVRKTIYEAVRQKQLSSLTQTDAKNALKEEINAALGKLLGKEVIRAIYFTKFFIL